MEKHEAVMWSVLIVCCLLFFVGLQGCMALQTRACEETRREAIKAGMKAEVFLRTCGA